MANLSIAELLGSAGGGTVAEAARSAGMDPPISLRELHERIASNSWTNRTGSVDLQQVKATRAVEAAGDEPVLALFSFSFRLGGDAILVKETKSKISNMPVDQTGARLGENWFHEGETHAIENGTYSFEDVQPLTAFGLLPLIIEMNGSSSAQRKRAIDCMAGALGRKLDSRRGTSPDFSNRSKSNVEFIVAQTIRSLHSFFLDFDNARSDCEDELKPTPIFKRADKLFQPALLFWIHAPGLTAAEIKEIFSREWRPYHLYAPSLEPDGTAVSSSILPDPQGQLLLGRASYEFTAKGELRP